MLNDLKQSIQNEQRTNFILEETSKRGAQDDIRDIFLDDVEGIVIGAEDDPEIAKLALTIPVYDEGDISDEELSKMIESLLPNIKSNVVEESDCDIIDAECYGWDDPYLNGNYGWEDEQPKNLINKDFNENEKAVNPEEIETEFKGEEKLQNPNMVTPNDTSNQLDVSKESTSMSLDKMIETLTTIKEMEELNKKIKKLTENVSNANDGEAISAVLASLKIENPKSYVNAVVNEFLSFCDKIGTSEQVTEDQKAIEDIKDPVNDEIKDEPKQDDIIENSNNTDEIIDIDESELDFEY